MSTVRKHCKCTSAQLYCQHSKAARYNSLSSAYALQAWHKLSALQHLPQSDFSHGRLSTLVAPLLIQYCPHNAKISRFVTNPLISCNWPKVA
mmetsp:Transcript_26685/g.39024  ORF Transcript_26685/g.39024 Transcript_26685/m.39024 type:complete len:92 (-) Transcript_26685:764-1039(-)